MPTSPAIQFLRHVEKSADGCWIWTGPTGKSGYGRILITSRTRDEKGSLRRLVPAHRVMWRELTGDWPPEGQELHHACGHRACVNPEHLQLLSASMHQRVHGKLQPTCQKCGTPYSLSRDGSRRRCMACRTQAWTHSPAGKAWRKEYYRHYYRFQRYGTPMPAHIEVPPPS